MSMTQKRSAHGSSSLCGVVSIVGALLYSLIPQFIDSSHWWVIVGDITLACLIFAAISDILASSEADWEKTNQ